MELEISPPSLPSLLLLPLIILLYCPLPVLLTLDIIASLLCIGFLAKSFGQLPLSLESCGFSRSDSGFRALLYE